MIGQSSISVALGTTASQLQAMINTAAPGTVLQLQAGHYQFDKTIAINRNDISVAGAGSDKTFIDLPQSLGSEAFKVGNGAKSGDFNLAANVAEGGRTLTLAGSHSFVAGDYVDLSRDSTNAFYDQIGDNVWRNTDVPLRTSIVEVVAVNGQTLTLASGVHFDFPTGETSVREIKMAEGIKLGGFTVDYGLAKADASKFQNTLSNYDRNAVIEVVGTAGLSLYDIRSHDIPSVGVNVGSSTGMDARGITMTGAHNKGDGGNGYGLQIRDVYDSSFIDISDRDMRHSVVFSSWQTSVGNFVKVTETDRDINFHGSPDRDNVVMVDRSLRDADSDIIAPTLFVNTMGTHYGSVTKAADNEVRFGHVVGSRLGDNIKGYDKGARLEGAGGNDTLTGGLGNDLLNGGAGADVLTGGAGQDIASYTGNRSAFQITNKGGTLFEIKDMVGGQSVDMVSSVEWLTFNDGALRLSDMTLHSKSAVDGIFGGPTTDTPNTPTPSLPPTGSLPTAPLPPTAPAPNVLTGTYGKDVFDVSVKGTVVQGLGNWDVVRSTVDFTMADDVERLDLRGTAAINGTGGAANNQINGNEARNVVFGMDGNDKVRGRLGDDQISGGNGADSLHGDGGNDRIIGGAGQDRLTGGSGADVFVFELSSDSVVGQADKLRDFKSGTDRIDLSAIDANTGLAGNQAFEWQTSGTGAASLWVKSGYLYGDTDGNGIADLAIQIGSAVVAPTDFLF